MRLFLALLALGCGTPAEQLALTTAQGRLQGEAREGYVSYRGVPYASVSSRDGNFKRAGLAPLWHGVRESREVHCTETSNVAHCLQLDVHVPAGAGPWPVLAWVAAGGRRVHPATLLQHGIILVVVYHRIGPLGFLCLGEDKIPGNAGVKDVVLGLRWIRDNIMAFKGDAAKVVMAGQGFGAAVAEAVMLSPMASGLYHGVILQSGSVLAPWAFNYDAKIRALKLGEMLHEGGNISASLIKSNIEELVVKSNKFDMPYFSFGMCKEKAMKHEERLLSEAPLDLFSSNNVDNVPMIIGYNSDEAYIFASILKESRVTEIMSQKITFLLPEELKFLNDREMNQVARQVEDMYFMSNKSMRAVLDYHRDAYFVNHIHRSARLHASSPRTVYYYQLSYAGDRGVQEELGVQKTGAAHSDELAYLFSGKQLSGDEGTVQTHLVKLWTNFVKYMNPTLKETLRWEAVGAGRARLLDVGARAELRMGEFPHARAAAMWDDIYDKYYYARSGLPGYMGHG